MTDKRLGKLWGATLGLLGISAVGAGGVAIVASGRDRFDNLFKRHAREQGVKDWRWLKALAMVESGMNEAAINTNEPGGASLGLMQIYIKGYPNLILNRLPALENKGLWPPKQVDKLFEPEYNIQRGAAILGENQRSFGELRGVAVYNAWGSRLDPPQGPFRNQGYVNKVQKWYTRFTE